VLVEGVAAVNTSHAMPYAGLGPRRNYLVVLNELCRVPAVRTRGVVDRIDALTRANPRRGVGQMMILAQRDEEAEAEKGRRADSSSRRTTRTVRIVA
jgi:hypothetical protein